MNEELDEGVIDEGASGAALTALEKGAAKEGAEMVAEQGARQAATNSSGGSGLEDMLTTQAPTLDPYQAVADAAKLPFDIAAGAIDTFTKAQADRRNGFRKAVKGLKY